MLCAKHTSRGWTTDLRTGAVDRVPLTDPQDWNARLHVVNGSPLAKPYPLAKLFWIVTDTAEAHEVSYDREATYWCNPQHGPYFSRQDGEPGCWGADEIVGWADSCEDAEEAAELYRRLA